jgi:hypothetical protein
MEVGSGRNDGSGVMRALTDGQISFTSGRKISSFHANIGRPRERIERRARRKNGDGEERWGGMDLRMFNSRV